MNGQIKYVNDTRRRDAMDIAQKYYRLSNAVSAYIIAAGRHFDVKLFTFGCTATFSDKRTRGGGSAIRWVQKGIDELEIIHTSVDRPDIPLRFLPIPPRRVSSAYIHLSMKQLAIRFL
jgi:hypothetical protein